MERTINKELYKKNNANKYLTALIIGATLFLLLSVVYMYSGKLAASVKFGSDSFKEILKLKGKEYATFISLIQFLYQIPLFFFFIYIFKDDLKVDFEDFKKDKGRNIKIIIIGAISLLLATILVSIIYQLLGIEDISDNQEIIENSLLGGGGILMATSVVLFAPFVEEMLFRKSLCDTLKYKFNVPDIITIILSALIFSFMHVSDFDNLIFIFQYLPLALIIVLCYYFSKNIYVPMTVHFINNLVSVLLTYLLAWLGFYGI